ncbi:LLM class flavin-dependent oxidoreductase [Dehalococcoidia bacterium]|nr:LLM class flavin-dependent oxidoreductase [Dehalococcoidia bacterium]
MRFGLSILNQWLGDEGMSTKLAETVEQAHAAKEAGFDMITNTGQHYLTYPYQQPAILPYLAYLAAAADGMHVAATVLLLPLLSPVDVAESVASLDAMTGGRFILGVGLGYREVENIAFGTTPKERVPRMLESLEVMKRLWTENEVEYNGTFYTIPRVKLATRTVQKPYPPIWVGASSSPAVRRAARLGYPWLIGPHSTIATLEPQINMYKQILHGGGIEGTSHLPMIRELYVDTNAASAFDKARPYLEPKYQQYAAWGQDTVLPGQESFRQRSFLELAKDRFLIGSPDQVVEAIDGYQKRLGISDLIFRMQWPGMPHIAVMHQIDLLGQHVLPHFKRRSSANS